MYFTLTFVLTRITLPIYTENSFSSSVNMENLGTFFYHKVLPAAQIMKTSQLIHSDVIMAYNGGKDCTVLLELIEYFNLDIPVVVFYEHDTFLSLNKFTLDRLQKSPVRRQIVSSDIKKEINILVQNGVKAVIMGERFLDPGKPTSFFAPSSPGWPDYTIVNPIFNWNYSDIWFFLDNINAEYCELYKQGYTSIGSEKKTRPNPRLQNKHARELMNPLEERLGRL